MPLLQIPNKVDKQNDKTNLLPKYCTRWTALASLLTLRCLIRKANFSKGQACERKVKSISGVTAAETKYSSCCQVRAKVRDHSPLFCPVWSSPFVSQCRHGIVPSPLALRTKITLWNSCLDFFSLIVKGGSIAEVHSLMSRWMGGNRCTSLKILHMLKRICLMVFSKCLHLSTGKF